MKFHAELETEILLSMMGEVTISQRHSDETSIVCFSDPVRIRAMARELLRMADEIASSENIYQARA